MSHVFISHNHKDKTYALKLAEALKQRGVEYWIDNHIEAGDQWMPGVLDALTTCSAFIVLMTPNAQRSQWVNREILIALDRNIPVFPLLLEGEEFLWLIDIQYEDVREGILPPERFFERLSKVMNVFTSNQGEASPSLPQFEQAIVLNDSHRKADLRLLAELWYFINSGRINFIMSSIYNRNLEYSYYFGYIDKYFYVRELPEKHFIDKDIEHAFEVFEEVLMEFDNQFILDSTIVNMGGREVFKPSYKLPEIDPDRYSYGSEEDYRERSARHEETIKNTRRVKKSLAELIKFIQLKCPEFDFPNVPLWEEPSNP